MEMMANLTRYQDAVDSLGINLITVGAGPNGSPAAVPYQHPGQYACALQVKAAFPHIKIGALMGGDESQVRRVASDPQAWVESVGAYLELHPWVDELWTDWEVKDIQGTQLNEAHHLMSSHRPTFRYAGCVHNGEPAYWNETCQAYIEAAPNTTVQAAGTYWDNSPSGFDALLRDQVSDIGAANVAKMSPAVCPDCKGYNNTQEELYDRMDLICKLGMVDVSGFTFFEIVENRDVGQRWMNALRYFRTGRKAPAQ